MVGNGRDQDARWESTVLEELNSHNRLIERLLFQMKIRGRYDKDEIINQVFIVFQKKVETGKIRIEFSNGQTPNFWSCKPEGECKQIKFLNAYLKKSLLNHLRGLWNNEKKRELAIESEVIENLAPQSHLSELHNSFEEDEEICQLREKLNQLNNEERRILELAFFDTLSFREIAQRLKSENLPTVGHPGYSETTLRKKKQRALDKLRKQF